MTNQSTVGKLLEMRLTSMSDAFITQLDDSKMQEIPFEDRFGMLVDAEYTNRKNNGLKRLIRGASFDQRGGLHRRYQLHLWAQAEPCAV